MYEINEILDNPCSSIDKKQLIKLLYDLKQYYLRNVAESDAIESKNYFRGSANALKITLELLKHLNK